MSLTPGLTPLVVDEYTVEPHLTKWFIARLAIRFTDDTIPDALQVCDAFLDARYVAYVRTGYSDSMNRDQMTIYFRSTGRKDVYGENQ